MPCPVPGCADGVPSPLFYTLARVPMEALDAPTISPILIGRRATHIEERWARASLGIPGVPQPVDAWRKVES